MFIYAHIMHVNTSFWLFWGFAVFSFSFSFSFFLSQEFGCITLFCKQTHKWGDIWDGGLDARPPQASNAPEKSPCTRLIESEEWHNSFSHISLLCVLRSFWHKTNDNSATMELSHSGKPFHTLHGILWYKNGWPSAYRMRGRWSD